MMILKPDYSSQNDKGSHAETERAVFDSFTVGLIPIQATPYSPNLGENNFTTIDPFDSLRPDCHCFACHRPIGRKFYEFFGLSRYA